MLVVIMPNNTEKLNNLKNSIDDSLCVYYSGQDHIVSITINDVSVRDDDINCTIDYPVSFSGNFQVTDYNTESKEFTTIILYSGYHTI